jgi:4-hydroxy-tetrahydrodipicolinate synthase
MKNTIFKGFATALATPMTSTGVDYDALARLIDFQLEGGINGLVAVGTTGESATLEPWERKEVIRFTIDRVNGRVPVVAGTGTNNTAHVLDFTKFACDNGADGVLVVTPYYNKATQGGLIAHYTAVADASDKPVIIYNVPSRTGVDMSVSVYQELAKRPNIAGIKEASTDIGKILRIRAQCPQDFCIWAGNDHLTVPILSLGGKGVISVMSNLFPEQMNLMTFAALDGDFDTAAALQCHMLPWTDFLGCEVNPIPIKAAMAAIGYDCGPGRLPLTPLSPEHRHLLSALIS